MSETQSDKSQSDPFNQVIDFYDAWTKAWSKSMSDAATSERFAETMAQQMESSLEVMSLLRRQVGEATEQYLRQLNLPTRTEVISIADRLTRIEMTLDDLDAKLDDLLDRANISSD